MIKHIVFFKLEDNSQEHKQIIKDKLLSLQDKIEVLKSTEVGLNFATEDRAYDLALLCDFESKEDLQAYAIHPVHVEFVNYVKSKNTITKVVDYEY
ncbi:Dabb family protein [Sulfurospirillum arcachonense]|uniref:Dabb family protein n=1 Tax=Sulfurospirillum arcachonense TaxID=57666 RepID=UPI00046A7CCD|nr:Dabb family protein [Sulfurospirillum arcachonense]